MISHTSMIHTHRLSHRIHRRSPHQISQRTISTGHHPHTQLLARTLHTRILSNCSKLISQMLLLTSQPTTNALYRLVGPQIARLSGPRNPCKHTSAAAPSVMEMQTVTLPFRRTRHSFVFRHRVRGLQHQKTRRGRIRIPSMEEVPARVLDPGEGL